RTLNSTLSAAGWSLWMGEFNRSFIRPGSRRASDAPIVKLSNTINARNAQAPGQFSVPADRNSTAPIAPYQRIVWTIAFATMGPTFRRDRSRLAVFALFEIWTEGLIFQSGASAEGSAIRRRLRAAKPFGPAGGIASGFKV